VVPNETESMADVVSEASRLPAVKTNPALAAFPLTITLVTVAGSKRCAKEKAALAARARRSC
jgi:hypothetical protein